MWSGDGKEVEVRGIKEGVGTDASGEVESRWQERDVNNGASEWERGGGRSDPCRQGDGGFDWPEPREWVQGF